MIVLLDEIKTALSKVQGMRCWNIYSCTVGSSLSLDFGDRISPVSHSQRIEECVVDDGNYDGECNILIWCDWRLDTMNDAICSSDSTEEQIVEGVSLLRNQPIKLIEIFPPVWDASLVFSSGHTLKVFCNYVQEPSSMTNWDISFLDVTYFFGRGNHIEKGRRYVCPTVVDQDF